MAKGRLFQGGKEPFFQRTGVVLPDGGDISPTTWLGSLVVPAMVTGGEACADRAHCWEAYK